MENTKLTFCRNFIVLLISMLLCGCISIYYGKDLGWDLANYHFSNPYFFLHHRLTIDYWPATYPHVFFSPTADFLCYFLIRYFTDWQAVFISGAIHGANLWLVFLIANYFLPSNKYAIVFAFIIALLGMYGPTGLLEIGDFNVDHTSSIFILGFVLLQLHALKNYSNTKILSSRLIIAAGVMLGIAVGLKLTSAVFALGAEISFLMLIPVRIVDRVKLICLSSISIVIGDLLTSGYWMIILWKHFHNPFYPFFENIFNHRISSPPELREGYTSIMPKGLLKTIFYPFYFSFTGTGEGSFKDFRFLCGYTLLIIFVFKRLYKKIWNGAEEKIELSILWLLLFSVSSYIICQAYFASLRYMMALEMLSPLIIYLLVHMIIKEKKLQLGLTIAIFYFIALTMYPRIFPLRIAEYQGDYLNVKLPALIDDTPEAMVLLVYSAYALDLNPRPVTYLIPFLPEKWRYVGIAFRNGKFTSDPVASPEVYKRINTYPHNFYLLTATVNMHELVRAAKQFGLEQKGACAEIFSNRQKYTSGTLICPAVKSLR